MADAPNPKPFARERTELDRLHLSIWRTLHRMPHNKGEVNPAHRTYHPAYLASRVQQLETMVGALLALLLQKYPTMQQELFALMGEAYEAHVQDLELHAVVHNTAFHLAPHVKKKHLDEPVKVEGEPDEQS